MVDRVLGPPYKQNIITNTIFFDKKIKNQILQSFIEY